MPSLHVRLLLAVVVLGCGGPPADPCPQLIAENARIFVTGNTCKSGGLSVTKSMATTASCSAGIAKCSTSDLNAINSYLPCAAKVPACTSGNESATVNGLVSCAVSAFSGVSAECQSALK